MNRLEAEALFCCSVDLHFWEICLWNLLWRLKPKLVNISDISTHAPPHNHQHRQWSPDVEEGGGGGEVGEGGGGICRRGGEAEQPFLNCHHFPWQPIEQKPSFRLISHWLEMFRNSLPLFFIWKVHNNLPPPKVHNGRCADFLLLGGHHVNLGAGGPCGGPWWLLTVSLFLLNRF